MPAAIDTSLLVYKFTSAPATLACARLDIAKHVYTKEIIERLNSELGANLTFQQWLLGMHARKKIRTIESSSQAKYNFNCTSPIKEYIIAAFFGGQNFWTQGNQHPPAEQLEMQAHGVLPINASGSANIPLDDNLIDKVTLIAGQDKSPEQLKRFFKKENRIIIYDKFLNRKAAKTISILIAEAEPNASVTILTTSKFITEAEAGLTPLRTSSPNLKINITEITAQTARNIHDRHIFIGNRYHLRFTSGIDVFGPIVSGKYINDEGAIFISDVWDEFTPLTLQDITTKKYLTRLGI